MVANGAHIPGVAGSSPAPATIKIFWGDAIMGSFASREIIKDALREGDKIAVVGPDGQERVITALLMNMAVSIAEGKRWLRFPCTKSRILYINSVKDKASCINDIKEIYRKRQIPMKNADNFLFWSLRNYYVPLERLTSEILRRVEKNDVSTIIIDPLWKTGIDLGKDKDVYRFAEAANQVSSQTGCSIIFADFIVSAMITNRSLYKYREEPIFTECLDSAIHVSRFGLAKSRMKGRLDENVTLWRIRNVSDKYDSFDPINCWLSYPQVKICK